MPLHAASRLAAGAAGLIALAAIGPAQAQRPQCEFRTSGSLQLAFGVLDPGSRAGVTATTSDATVDHHIGDCPRGFRLSVTVGAGEHAAGGRNRLKHTGQNLYLPYSVTLEPATSRGPGRGQYIPLRITGRIEAADYANLPAGQYTDVLLLAVDP